MEFDISRAVDGRAVIASHTYPSPIDDVWDAITNPERIARWFLPLTGDLCLGGRYQLEGNAGGEITACEPPSHLAVTWEYGGDISWVDVRLTDEGGGRTVLRLEHLTSDGDPKWDEFGPGAVGVGWELTLLGLDWHLPAGASVTGEGAAWMASDEGRAFVRRSSEGWCEASIAAGVPEDEARAAAARTAAAYTGEG